jgi:hypothetical protein
MIRSSRREARLVALIVFAAVAAVARPAGATELWVAPTYQQDVGGIGVANNVVWPETPLGIVRLAWSVPADLQTFTSAKVVLIPSNPGGAATLNVVVCPAQNNGAVAAGCAGPFQQGFAGVPNQLVEVEIGGLLATRLGTPGSTYLAVLAFTTPTTTTDHIVGLRFSYVAPTASTGANTFSGPQTAPAFIGDGSGLTNLPPPSAGSSHYVQNATTPQALTSFNIDGSGTVGGALTGGIVTAATQFNLGSSRVLSVSGTANTNTLLGVQAGNANPTGSFNSFFGNGAGLSTSSGANNSFFGSGSGNANTAGGDNAFFGRNAGFANTASENAFFGSFAGGSNTSGAQNAFFGKEAGRSNMTGGANAFFGWHAGLNSNGGSNSFFGYQAGASNTTGGNNAFFGMNAGGNTTTGNNNSFFGVGTGNFNGSHSGNTFVGTNAGQTSLGDNNTAVGVSANITTFQAPSRATALGANTFVNGTNSTAIGANAITGQDNAIVLGSINGLNAATADVNVGIGTPSPGFKLQVNDQSNTGIRVQTATTGGTVASFGGNGAFQIDANGTVGGRLAVAENGNVGVGTNDPHTKLQVAGSVYVQNPNSLIITSPNGACWFITVNNSGGLSTIPVTCP